MTMSAGIPALATPRQSSVDEAWRGEIRQRINDINSGRVQWLDADEVDAELLAELDEMDKGR